MTRRLLLAAAAGVLPLAAQDRLVPLDEAVYQKLIASARGKVLLVNFWATWCEPCRAEMPALAKLAASLRAQGFQLVTVSADEPEDEAAARQFLQKSGVQGPAYLKRVRNDDAFITSVDPKWSGALPALILFDRAGRKARAFTGETDLKALEAAIRELLAAPLPDGRGSVTDAA
ncbi:MAG: TlpA disulfide reductase family protein, partial [Bryobacterales bacterium]|nr:TlpA disulfide reductase family protein [Bryobacterales bacterium]